MGRIIPAVSENEPALNPAEACAFLGGVTRQTLDNYKRLGRRGRRLPAHKVGGRVFFLASQLREFTAPEAEAAESPAAGRTSSRHGRAGKINPATVARLRQQGYRI